MSDLHPDQRDVPEPRPPADQSDAQSVNMSAPSDQPKEASKEVQLWKEAPPAKLDRELFELVPPEDRLEAFKYHQDAQLIAGLSAEDKRDYLQAASTQKHRYQFANLVALPAMGLCGSIATLIVTHVHHVSGPWDIAAGVTGVASGGLWVYRVGKKKVDARKKKEAKLAAAATTPDHSPPAGG